MKYRIHLLVVALLFLGACSSAEQVAQNNNSNDRTSDKYSEIISKADSSEEGLFTIYQKDGKLWYDIPAKELNKELLLISRIVRAQEGTGHGGMRYNNHVVTWEKVGNRILLKANLYQAVADSTDNIYEAVRNSNMEPIIASLPIEATSTDGDSYIIEVTRLFTTDVSELSPRSRYAQRNQARRVDSERSYIERARAFPDNIEVTNVITMDAENPPADRRLSTITLTVNHSMIRLPEVPMMPRIHDERVGYFSVQQTDFSSREHRADNKRYITRWRLEKENPDAEISDPKEPIIWYVDRATPEWLIPYVIEGINDWQPAFEQAGFSNAIIGKLAPSPEEDPDFSPEDARYPMIRWMSSRIANARGPHTHDPRSGEIITSSVEMYHNVMGLLRNWYFVQGAAVDERVRHLPMPDSVMGHLVRYVVAHEVGHSIGLPHNMKASASVPTDSLRSPTFTRKYGTTPSIMDYARMNYVAQPGDDAYMFPIVSIYDKFAIEWGYSEFPNVNSPQEERPFLNEIAARQADNPMLRFGNPSSVDPTQQTEALGDNHVKSSEYGIANLKRIMGFIVDSATEEGENYDTLEELYNNVVTQRQRYLLHVSSWIGGVIGERKVAGQDGTVHTPVSRERQKEAMEFLKTEAFTTPEYLLDTEILSLIEPSGASERVNRSQLFVLSRVMSDDRIVRMTELETIYGAANSYTVEEMFTDLRDGVWTELNGNNVSVDFYRRNLQRSYLDIVARHLHEDSDSSGETKAMMRGNLREIKTMADRSAGRAANTTTRYHLQDVSDRITSILD